MHTRFVEIEYITKEMKDGKVVERIERVEQTDKIDIGITADGTFATIKEHFPPYEIDYIPRELIVKLVHAK